MSVIDCINWIIYQQLWGYKVEEKLYLGVREQKRLNTTALETSAVQRFYIVGRIGLMAVEERAPCGD
jgi:hypothetical protein